MNRSGRLRPGQLPNARAAPASLSQDPGTQPESAPDKHTWTEGLGTTAFLYPEGAIPEGQALPPQADE